MDKYAEYNKFLKKCKCGGNARISGGDPWCQDFSIICDSCHGIWNMNTYSLKEAAEKWGMVIR